MFALTPKGPQIKADIVKESNARQLLIIQNQYHLHCSGAPCAIKQSAGQEASLVQSGCLKRTALVLGVQGHRNAPGSVLHMEQQQHCPAINEKRS